MKFGFDKNKCSDIGLIVKHGNKDNVVLFFDEVENAATYKAVLFRTDVVYGTEKFLSEGNITQRKIKLRHFDNNIEEKDYTLLNDHSLPLFIGNNLVYQTKYKSSCESYCFDDSRNWMSSGRECEIYKVNEVPFEKVKYITQLESSRNDLYINIDFLPCGNYIVIVQAEDRNGQTIKCAMPYYFKVNEISNKEILNAINGAGRAAAGNVVGNW